MNRLTACTLAGTGALALTATMVAGPAGATKPRAADRGPYAVGLTEAQRLVAFSVSTPERTRAIGRVSGLSGDTELVGIDFRVQDRLLYGVGDRGGVYYVRTKSARASKVSQLTVPLEGTAFGVDFNPAADRLRVTSNTGQNLRHDVNQGGATLADTTLTYPPATTPATGVTGSAYTNNDLGADTATSLFDLDTDLDQVALQAPANSGTLSPTGRLGVDAGSKAGFDVYSNVRDGSTVGNSGYASLSVGGKYRLYRVSLLTGDVVAEGRFPTYRQVSDIAVRLDTSDR
jgi:hypothetical protein